MLRFSQSLSLRNLLAFSALSILPMSMHAGTIFSETFSTATLGFGVTTAGQFSAINGTQVDVLGSPNGFAFECIGEAGPCVDLGGSANPTGNPANNGDLTAVVTAPSAGVYYLSFVLVGNSVQASPDTFTVVNLGGYSHLFDIPTQNTSVGVVVNQAVTLAAGANTLEFLNSDSGSLNGSILESVSVSSAVPEPASAVLLGSALMLASFIRKRVVR